jgi:hypothetical protein
MTVRLSTTVSNIEKIVSNEENVQTMLRFFEFMKKIGTSERYHEILTFGISRVKGCSNIVSAIVIYCRNSSSGL